MTCLCNPKSHAMIFRGFGAPGDSPQKVAYLTHFVSIVKIHIWLNMHVSIEITQICIIFDSKCTNTSRYLFILSQIWYKLGVFLLIYTLGSGELKVKGHGTGEGPLPALWPRGKYGVGVWALQGGLGSSGVNVPLPFGHIPSNPPNLYHIWLKINEYL